MSGVLLGALILAACGSDGGPQEVEGSIEPSDDADTVTVYTGRHYGIEPVFEQFTEDTGIKVRFTTGNDPELRERLIAEGENTPADVLMTADASNAELAAEAGVLATVDSEKLDRGDPRRAARRQRRVVRPEPAGPRRRLEHRACRRPTARPMPRSVTPEWKGKLCLRPSTHPYTQSLVASIIIAEGEERATEIVQSWVDNDPLYINSDTDIYQAVADGECDIAIANTYYLGRLLAEDPDFPVEIVWPEQDGRGAHVNVSTAAVTKNAPNAAAALTLLEWLATDGQKQFADANFEFPADPTVEPDPIVASWGEFVADLAAVKQLGQFQPAAVELLSATGYE